MCDDIRKVKYVLTPEFARILWRYIPYVYFAFKYSRIMAIDYCVIITAIMYTMYYRRYYYVLLYIIIISYYIVIIVIKTT